MKPDHFAMLGEQEYQNGFANIDYSNIDVVTTRYHVLVATDHKTDKNTGGGALRSEWGKRNLNRNLGPLPDFLATPKVDLGLLPFGSFYIQFQFQLLKPYISRDDNPFYIVDNPIVREKVFRFPMVRATAWKGSLRHALWQLGYQTENDQIKRLFGDANDTDNDGQRGRLYFYPSFFTQTSLEVINPHDRKTGAGTFPIYFEAVPIGATATFTLLYAPLDRVEEDKQVFDDLQLVAEGLQAMFTTYGFGAKTSSGFGLAENEVENGVVVLKGFDLACSDEPTQTFERPDETFVKYLDENGFLKSVFAGNGEAEPLSNSEYANKGQQAGGGTLSEFKKFKQWYANHSTSWQKHLDLAQTNQTDHPSCQFKTFNQLLEIKRK